MRSFGLFWLAQSISRFGDPITLIALAAVTYRATASAFYTALAVVIATLPNAAFGFVGGAIADSLGPRRAMIVCDLARAGLIGAVPAVISSAGLGWAYVCVFGAALCGAVFTPARFAIIPQLVAPARLAEANSRIASTDRTVQILGALAAGALVQAFGPGAFYVDAMTFLVAGLLLTRLATGAPPRWALSVAGILRDTGTGLRFLFASAVLRANTTFSLVAQLGIPVANGLTPVLLTRRFAGGDADQGAALFGIAEATLAAGAMTAGLMLPEYLEHHRKGRVLVAGFAGYGLLLVLLGLAPIWPVALLVFFGLGVTNVIFVIPNITIAQEATPPALLARVAGARIALLNLTWVPVFVVSGALADHVEAGLLIAVAGLFTLATVAVGSTKPAIRDVA